jgi:hypothetical protein
MTSSGFLSREKPLDAQLENEAVTIARSFASTDSDEGFSIEAATRHAHRSPVATVQPLNGPATHRS